MTRATLAPGETSGIVATFNTSAFLGAKAATVTVVFDQPYFAEVRLTVSGEILTDVQFEPSEGFRRGCPGKPAPASGRGLFTGYPDLHIKDVLEPVPTPPRPARWTTSRAGQCPGTDQRRPKSSAPVGERSRAIPPLTPRLIFAPTSGPVFGVSGPRTVAGRGAARSRCTFVRSPPARFRASECCWSAPDEPFEIKNATARDPRFMSPWPRDQKRSTSSK